MPSPPVKPIHEDSEDPSFKSLQQQYVLLEDVGRSSIYYSF